jgi:hypothetical protein
LPRSDGGGVVEEAVFFFLLGQLGEFGVEGVLRCEHGFLAVEGRRICGGVVFEAIDFTGAERELDAAEQGGVGLFWEQRLLFPSTPGASQTSFAISVILNIDVEAPK